MSAVLPHVFKIVKPSVLAHVFEIVISTEGVRVLVLAFYMSSVDPLLLAFRHSTRSWRGTSSYSSKSILFVRFCTRHTVGYERFFWDICRKLPTFLRIAHLRVPWSIHVLVIRGVHLYPQCGIGAISPRKRDKTLGEVLHSSHLLYIALLVQSVALARNVSRTAFPPKQNHSNEFRERSNT